MLQLNLERDAHFSRTWRGKHSSADSSEGGILHLSWRRSHVSADPGEGGILQLPAEEGILQLILKSDAHFSGIRSGRSASAKHVEGGTFSRILGGRHLQLLKRQMFSVDP